MGLHVDTKLLEQLVTAWDIVRLDGKASNDYIERRLGVTPVVAATLGSALEQMGLVGERDENGNRPVHTVMAALSGLEDFDADTPYEADEDELAEDDEDVAVQRELEDISDRLQCWIDEV